MLAAVAQTSPQSLYRRFFGAKRHLTDQEVAFFLNVDVMSHVALIAVAEEAGQHVIVGGARYVVTRPGQAEVAFTVVDRYQGQGIGAALMRHLIGIARKSGLTELTAEVLPDNTPMLTLFKRCGLTLNMRRDAEAVHVALQLA